MFSYRIVLIFPVICGSSSFATLLVVFLAVEWLLLLLDGTLTTQVILCNNHVWADQVRNISSRGVVFLNNIWNWSFDLEHTKHKGETVWSFCFLFSSLMKKLLGWLYRTLFQQQGIIIPSGFMESLWKSAISVRQLGENWGSISCDAPSSGSTHHQDCSLVKGIPLNLYFRLRLGEHPNLYPFSQTTAHMDVFP